MKHQTDSLWTALNDYVRLKGQVSYGEMVQFTLDLGYKVSVMERRLRKSESPNIESIEVKSKRGTKYIGLYKWRGEKEEKENMTTISGIAVPIRNLVLENKQKEQKLI